ncbi:hypothetical protein [Lactobacillus johnsonii]|uniref:hypothetical protein n=1 Tax=Lactobacillus johnsonii TaxID=33959 RepID=UPI001FB1A911|nr:hypothetical protein [Lactobacillus johnsonii]UOC05984.1 hypothetical protein LC811_09220 [Lactobacillus johnsonii]
MIQVLEYWTATNEAKESIPLMTIIIPIPIGKKLKEYTKILTQKLLLAIVLSRNLLFSVD